ncbi:hypothetical protein C8F04DRAFT_1066237 [Mycena alexandri]|uniref:RanBD1 domain-containing protein n=1 Tax=Mycena alexandri TaxID=1745969 RepID=A0AAD6XHV5_9AGAR|nr:hypothetical protein C8F04DRAFT_1066237 [Mycena alexandri]
MKRGAERQISKGEDDPEVEEVSGDGAFHKADDAVLATRKIKGMPRRMAGSPLGASVSDSAIGNGSVENPATPSPTKFSSFSGFGTPGSAGNAFSFAPPSSSPSFPPPSKPTSSIFGPTPGTPTPSTLFSSGTPAVAPTASNATKTFASFLGDSSSKPTTNSAPPPQPQFNTPAAAADSDVADDAELKYYSSLRGLNVSILAAITKAIDQDPFTDVAGLLSRYSSLRVDVQKEFDDRAKSDAPARSSAPSPSPFGAPPAAPSSSATPVAPLRMPAPPPVFAGFGKPAEPKTNGAADPPPPPAAPNPFAFSSSSSTTPKPSIFAPSAPSPFPPSSSSSSTFGSPASTSVFGSGFGAAASPFGTNASPFGGAASPSPFGGAKSTPSVFGGAGGSGFGSSTPPPFSFSNGSGSIGNPVGFGFGSPKGEAGPDKGEEKKAADEKKEEGDGDGDGTDAGSQETEVASTTDEASSGSTLFGNDTPTGLDAEGEGEEDEETVQTARIKAFRLRKKEEAGDGGWLDIGIGFLRLKRHKETSARRLLLRNSHSGKILINFALYSGLKASQAKKSLTFVGHDAAGEPQTYSLRFRSEDTAKEFQAALDKEIAEIKAS